MRLLRRCLAPHARRGDHRPGDRDGAVRCPAARARLPDAAVVDVREPEEFAGGHVPGAINLPQADLATRLEEIPRDRPVFVICQGGFRSLRAAQFLSQCGIADVASVQGGTEAWRAAGGELIRASARLPRKEPGIIETEWTHAGGNTYVI